MGAKSDWFQRRRGGAKEVMAKEQGWRNWSLAHGGPGGFVPSRGPKGWPPNPTTAPEAGEEGELP